MIFQWYVFVLILAVGVMAPLFGQVHTVNTYGGKYKQYGWIAAFAIIIPMVYLAGTRGNPVWGDTVAYRIAFNNLPSSLSGLSDYFTDSSKDKGFTVFSVIIKSVFGNNSDVYFTVIAAICIFCVVATYKKFSCNFIMSVFLFIASADYVQWTYNGIRQFIPVAILFACAGLIAKKKYIPVIILILLLSTVHATVLLMIPMIFVVQGKPFNKRTLAFLLVVLLSIGFIDQFTDIITNIMQNTQYSGEIDQFLSTEGTSVKRVLVYSIPAVLALVFRKRIIAANDPLLNISTNMAIAACGTYVLAAFSSGLFLGRLPIYFSLYNYILLPWEIENIFTKKSVNLIYIIMIVLYMVYFIYQTKYVWGLI